MTNLKARINNAWLGRISGCQLGKPVELLSMRKGYDALASYLHESNSDPRKGYINYIKDKDDDNKIITKACCAGHLQRSEPDDDINYSLLALMMLEQHGEHLQTIDVARAWLRHLPVGQTFTAERAAYRVLLEKGSEWFPEGADPKFDLADCAQNPFNDWIGAQIRADVYGWVCPGDPAKAVRLATADAELSHQREGVWGAVVVAALAAALQDQTPEDALATALSFIPQDSDCAAAVNFGRSLVHSPTAGEQIRERYKDLSPVHTVNNLAIVVWALYSHLDDFGGAIGSAVAAGLDTDCNGATVGGLWGISGREVPDAWTAPWNGRVAVSLAGISELSLDSLVNRTLKVAQEVSAV